MDALEPPPPDYLHFDIHGLVNFSGHKACVGVLRNYRGDWIMGFQQSLDMGGSSEAELEGIRTGLELCKEHSLNKIRFHTGSLEGIKLITRDCSPHHPLRSIINQIRHLICQLEEA